MNATAERVGLNIQNLRTSRGWTQEELAHEAGIDRSYVSEIELGRSSATIEKLEQIAVAFEVDIEDLIKKRGQTMSKHEQNPNPEQNPGAQRQKAEPISLLTCPKNGTTMGHCYRWNNGEPQLSVYPEFEYLFFSELDG